MGHLRMTRPHALRHFELQPLGRKGSKFGPQVGSSSLGTLGLGNDGMTSAAPLLKKGLTINILGACGEKPGNSKTRQSDRKEKLLHLITRHMCQVRWLLESKLIVVTVPFLEPV